MQAKKIYKKISIVGICIISFAFSLIGCSKRADSESSAVSSKKPDLSTLTDDELVSKIKDANNIKTILNKYKLSGSVKGTNSILEFEDNDYYSYMKTINDVLPKEERNFTVYIR